MKSAAQQQMTPSITAAPGVLQLTDFLAMSNCYGEHYLGEQFRSSYVQAFLPGDFMICDVNSTDRTTATVREFARHAHVP